MPGLTSRIRSYRRQDLRFDLVGGLALAAFAVPEGLANAHLAGLRPEIGLYAGVAGAVGYAALGRSHALVVGTDPALAILLGGTIGGLAAGDPSRAAGLAAFVAIAAGVLGLVARLLRLGFLSNLMSTSVLAGFFVGAGLTVIVAQLPECLGIEGHGGTFWQQLGLFRHLDQAHGTTVAIAASTLLLLVVGERLLPGKPVSLFVLALGGLLSWALGLSAHGVTLVGPAQRLPGLSFPVQALDQWKALLPLAASAFLLSYVQNISAARKLAARHHEPVDPDGELLASGACNLTAGFLGGMPVAANVSRSLDNEEIARTRLASFVSAVLLVLVMTFGRKYLGRLPHAILAATIINEALALVDPEALLRIYAVSRRELVTAGVTVLGVLLFGLLWGVLIGVAATLFDMLERVNRPHIAVVGRDPGSGRYEDLEEAPHCETVPGTLVLRIDVSIFSANAESIRREVLRRVKSEGPALRLVVLDMEASPLIDVSGAGMLDQLHEAFKDEGITLRLAEAKRAVRQLLSAHNPGKFLHFPANITDAIAGTP